jgi:UDP-N-acetylmuramoyl-tripeptide--D-alanyl-D-alanine ligase
MLRSMSAVHATPYNSNDRYGVPRTLLDLPNIYNFSTLLAATPKILQRLIFGPPKYDFIVLEMGARLPGTLPRQLQFFRPSISVITSIAPAHLETLGSLEGVFQEKSSLVSAVGSEGHAVLCFDDPMVQRMKDLTSAPTTSYGFSPSADVWMEAPEREGSGISTTLHDSHGSVELHFPRLSNRHHLYAVMAAWSVGLITELPRDAMANAVQNFAPTHGRGRVIFGPLDSLLYDDSYNANPLSMRSAIEAFDSIAGQRRRIIILGDMLELGSAGEHLHAEIGGIAGDAGDVLFAIGAHARHYAAAFSSRKPVNKTFEFSAVEDACATIKREIRNGDAILLKGSHSTGVHKLASYLQKDWEQD